MVAMYLEWHLKKPFVYFSPMTFLMSHVTYLNNTYRWFA